MKQGAKGVHCGGAVSSVVPHTQVRSAPVSPRIWPGFLSVAYDDSLEFLLRKSNIFSAANLGMNWFLFSAGLPQPSFQYSKVIVDWCYHSLAFVLGCLSEFPSLWPSASAAPSAWEWHFLYLGNQRPGVTALCASFYRAAKRAFWSRKKTPDHTFTLLFHAYLCKVAQCNHPELTHLSEQIQSWLLSALRPLWQDIIVLQGLHN